MSDDAIVADASAILALLKEEPIGQFDPRRLFRATVGAVNLSEILEKLVAGGMTDSEADHAVGALSLQVVAFDEAQARSAARLRRLTRHLGLSLGDRACLALGAQLHCAVATADRAWAGVDVGVEVLLIR